MEEINVTKKEKVEGRDLVDLVLSWSIDQVLNPNLYGGQVNKIPETFISTSEYTKTFIPPLIEETHAELLSSVQLLPEAPAFEVSIVGPCKYYKPPKDLFYKVSLKMARNGAQKYEPLVGDLIVLSDVRPTCVDDLKRNYVPAFVYKNTGGTSCAISVLSSKPIEEGFIKNRQMLSIVEQGLLPNNGKVKLFAVYLINMTTNIRIWNALNSKLEGKNMGLIKKVLKANCLENEACRICNKKKKKSSASSKIMENLPSFNLNNSQEEAVLSCIKAGECFHRNTVKLIWGPPGTGKTKTVCILLCALFQMKCRTLTCAPTNIAVVEVATQARKSLVDMVGCETYGVGDIVLFGKRMKIDQQNDVLDVFLDSRAKILKQCFSHWSNCLISMINLLENPEDMYAYYLLDNSHQKNDEEENINEQGKDIKSCNDLRLIDKNKGHKPKNKKKARSKEKEVEVEVEDDHSENSVNSEEKSELLTLEEFVQKRFKFINEKLQFCITSLYTHLPTSYIPLKVVKDMIQVIKLLKSLEEWLFSANFVCGGLKEILEDCENVCNKTRKECVKTLRKLPPEFTGQNFNNEMAIRTFCLSNACLLFCTASSSIQLHAKYIAKVQCVVIDEAAQLKECESSIPLQLNGLRHAILVGDEQQLSAMVNSPISKEAGFGRSLFERMVNLQYRPHLLDVQYRMHPSISKFPNAEFYGNRISDALNVTEESHNGHFLKNQMYGNYSFINIAHGQEEFDNSGSLRNVVEVAAVADIVSRLFNVFNQTKKRVSVGIITPYEAQVRAIQKKIAKHSCPNSDADFTVNVRFVDGFQGGEEDVIIISTVRCNRNGVVGFLSDKQRANVALTRARYCLWILGNEETLVKSGSIWRNVVEDAKGRGCFYDATVDKSLANAISLSLLQLDQPNIDALLTMDTPLYSKDKARWKVCLTDEFRASMKRMKNLGTRREVISLLGKLTSGWRQSEKKKKVIENDGLCWQVMEQYKVNEKLVMVWSVDIVLESSFEVQFLKIWDVLTSSEIPKMAKKFDHVIRNYSVNKMHCCQYRSMEGNLVVPMKWEMDASFWTSQDLNPQPISVGVASIISVQPASVGVASNTNKLQDHKKEMDASSLTSQDLNPQPTSVGIASIIGAQPTSVGDDSDANKLQDHKKEMDASSSTSRDLNPQPISVGIASIICAQPTSVGDDSDTNNLQDDTNKLQDHKKEMDASSLTSQDLNPQPTSVGIASIIGAQPTSVGDDSDTNKLQDHKKEMDASSLTSQDLNPQPISVKPASVRVASNTNKLQDHKKEMDASFLTSQDLNPQPTSVGVASIISFQPNSVGDDSDANKLQDHKKEMNASSAEDNNIVTQLSSRVESLGLLGKLQNACVDFFSRRGR